MENGCSSQSWPLSICHLAFAWKPSSGMNYKVILYVVLIAIYVHFFGITSVDRFLEDSIVTIQKSQEISSLGLELNPGKT